MASLESVFIKEFNRGIRMSGAVKDIYKVPLPEECKSWKVSGCELYGVNGLGESSGLFRALNGTLVKKIPRNADAKKRKVDLVTRDFVRGNDGRFVYEDVKVPSGSMVVISDKSLNLPYNYKCEDPGFGYIDFITVGGNREFLYYIPKKNMFKVNQTALALSVKNMKNYSGMGYLSWKFGTIYLHIIPYAPTRSYVGSKILKTGYSLNFTEEVRKIVDFWEENRVIPRIQLCETSFNGNLVLRETQRGYEVYNPVDELSVGDRITLGDEVDEVVEES